MPRRPQQTDDELFALVAEVEEVDAAITQSRLREAGAIGSPARLRDIIARYPAWKAGRGGGAGMPTPGGGEAAPADRAGRRTGKRAAAESRVEQATRAAATRGRRRGQGMGVEDGTGIIEEPDAPRTGDVAVQASDAGPPDAGNPPPLRAAGRRGRARRVEPATGPRDGPAPETTAGPGPTIDSPSAPLAEEAAVPAPAEPDVMTASAPPTAFSDAPVGEGSLLDALRADRKALLQEIARLNGLVDALLEELVRRHSR